MFDDRRDLFRSLALHAFAAALFLAAAWYLFESTRGTSDADKRLLGLCCAVAAGIIIARPLAALIAEPTGSLFFPRRAVEPAPGYSRAEAQRKRGEPERAIAEYEEIAAQFPAEVHAYAVMMEIAVVDLNDPERARRIAQRGLAALPDEPRRMELLRAYRALAVGSFGALADAQARWEEHLVHGTENLLSVNGEGRNTTAVTNEATGHAVGAASTTTGHQNCSTIKERT